MKPLKGIKLKQNRILIEKFSKVEKTAAGIYLPEEEQEAPEGGVVVAVGPDVDPTNAKLGEKVRFMQHGQEMVIGKKPYYLLRDGDVWGEIE